MTILKVILVGLALNIVATYADHDEEANFYTNLNLKTSGYHPVKRIGGYNPEENTRCLLQLHDISHLQGKPLKFWNSKLLNRKDKKGRKTYGLKRVKRRFSVRSLSTTGPCCWKVCWNRKGRCKGRILDGNKRINLLAEIKIGRVKRVKAMTSDQCKSWNQRKYKRKP